MTVSQTFLPLVSIFASFSLSLFLFHPIGLFTRTIFGLPHNTLHLCSKRRRRGKRELFPSAVFTSLYKRRQTWAGGRAKTKQAPSRRTDAVLWQRLLYNVCCFLSWLCIWCYFAADVCGCSVPAKKALFTDSRLDAEPRSRGRHRRAVTQMSKSSPVQPAGWIPDTSPHK